ncbi:GNAT family N-acetyltransferase [Agrobacterium tumefaciens]|uniref:GNAT family N-acetyltransferase n=1 Tax=Agrobacterium tumefaciens TaxID=358 RepID=UPI0009763EB6|nr:GNAT family N-acetyltransferase [Agrobacterium tumefaciens]
MNIREAKPDDRDAITTLHISVSQQTYAGMLPADYLTDIMPQEKTSLWKRRLAQGVNSTRMCLKVAEEASAAAGFACFLFNEETDFGSYLHNLYVASSHQGRGLARTLLAESIRSFPADRLDRPVHLLTLRDNHPARSFYNRIGGQQGEERRNVMTHLPQVVFVRYQWPSAHTLLKNMNASSEQ